jgi:hypothetical protein
MADLYLLPRALSYSLTVLIALCVISQTLLMVMRYYRYVSNRVRFAEVFSETFILGHIIVCSLLHGQAIQAFDMGLYMSGGYTVLRMGLFAAVMLSAVIAFLINKKMLSLAVIFIAAMTLPLIESLTGNAFAYIYITAIAAWLARSTCMNIRLYKEINTRLSAFSIKNAIDALHTGVLFCDRDGYILLINKQMQWLMAAITGKPHRNGKHFMGLLSLGDVEPDNRVELFEGQNVCFLQDGTAWMFTVTELPIGKKTYFQLTAADGNKRGGRRLWMN